MVESGGLVVRHSNKRISYACDACKKRKGKCSGDLPCTYCEKNNMPCAYLKENKKRGPRESKKPKNELAYYSGMVSPSALFSEDTLCSDFEKVQLADIFLEYTFHGTALCTTREKLISPTSIAQKMLSRAALALVLRGTGHLARAEQYVADARVFAGQALEESSVDSGSAYLILGYYYPRQHHMHSVYAAVAHTIAKQLPRKDITEQRLYYISFLITTILDNDMVPKTKLQLLKDLVPRIMKLGSPGDVLAAMMTEMYCSHSLILDLFATNQTLPLLKDVILTTEQANSMLLDLKLIEFVIDQHDFGSAKKSMQLNLKVIKVVVLWRAGDIQKALAEAEFAETSKCVFTDDVRYSMTQSLRFAWILTMFFYCVGELEKAEDLHNTIKKHAKKALDDMPPLSAALFAPKIHQVDYITTPDYVCTAAEDGNTTSPIADTPKIDFAALLRVEANNPTLVSATNFEYQASTPMYNYNNVKTTPLMYNYNNAQTTPPMYNYNNVQTSPPMYNNAFQTTPPMHNNNYVQATPPLYNNNYVQATPPMYNNIQTTSPLYHNNNNNSEIENTKFSLPVNNETTTPHNNPLDDSSLLHTLPTLFGNNSDGDEYSFLDDLLNVSQND